MKPILIFISILVYLVTISCQKAAAQPADQPTNQDAGLYRFSGSDNGCALIGTTFTVVTLPVRLNGGLRGTGYFCAKMSEIAIVKEGD